LKSLIFQRYRNKALPYERVLNKRNSLLFLLLCLIYCNISGCALFEVKPIFLITDYNTRQPRSIAVLPLKYMINIQGEDPKLEELVIKELRSRRYNIIEMEQTIQGLSKSNLTSDDLYSSNSEEMCKIICGTLRVDAILKTYLYDYRSEYFVIGRTDRLSIEFFLIDGKSGEILWRHGGTDEESGFGLLDASIPRIPGWIQSVFRSLPKATGGKK